MGGSWKVVYMTFVISILSIQALSDSFSKHDPVGMVEGRNYTQGHKRISKEDNFVIGAFQLSERLQKDFQYAEDTAKPRSPLSGRSYAGLAHDVIDRGKRSNPGLTSMFRDCREPNDVQLIRNTQGPLYWDREYYAEEWNYNKITACVNGLRCGSEVGLLMNISDDGTFYFRAPCCATSCIFNVDIEGTQSEINMIEFLDINIPSPHTLNSDGSVSCLDARVVFPLEGKQFCGTTVPKPFEVTGQRTNIVVQTYGNYICENFLWFRLKPYICEVNPQSQCQRVVEGDGKSGFISSPGFRKEFPSELGIVTCEWMIEVASNNLLQLDFISMIHLIGDYDVVSVTTNSQTHIDKSDDIDFSFAKYDFLGIPEYRLTLPTNRANVSFFARDTDRGNGFRLHYKAASKETYVPMLDKFEYNCTGYEHSLPKDILCNFDTDCSNGEDERNCSYRDNGRCPRGFVSESSCYVFPRVRPFDSTWDMAEKYCIEQYGGHLATFASQKEINFVSDVFLYMYGNFYLGIRQFSLDTDFMYRRLYQGLDGLTIFGGFWQHFTADLSPCTSFSNDIEFERFSMRNIPCQSIWEVVYEAVDLNFLSIQTEQKQVKVSCEVTITDRDQTPLNPPQSSSVAWTEKMDTYQCNVSLERIFISRRCDGNSDCFDGTDEDNCADVIDASEVFSCRSGQLLWYSHVCDGISDCSDNSDEDFCLPAPDDNPDMAVCDDRTPVPSASWCDAKPDCFDGSDELDCLTCNGASALCPSVGCMPSHWAHDDSLDCPIKDPAGEWVLEPDFVPHTVFLPPPPGVVMPDGYGKVTIQQLNISEKCPLTHAQCPNGYCIPLYMLCNGYKDCPEGGDELQETCQAFCKGHYKCHMTSTCVHDDHVCDGWFHCPHQDDEAFCFGNNTMLSCPSECVCSGKEISCHQSSTFPDFGCIKGLDISNMASQATSLNVDNPCLITLNARGSGLRQLGELVMVNLFKLDLSDNYLKHLDIRVFENVQGLRQLSLARNNFVDMNLQPVRSLTNLEKLDISGNYHKYLRSNSFLGCTRLITLYLDDMGITVVEDGAFAGLPELRTLSLGGNPIAEFQSNIFTDLSQLSTLTTDNFKLCCSIITPQVLSTGTCIAPTDEISSCEDILRTPFFRAFLWLMAVLTVMGNSGVLLYRLCIDRKPSKFGYNTFLTSLSASDLLMGVYLVVIGGADEVFRGRYLWESDQWKESTYCTLAGVLSIMSSEVSAITISMVTLDRFLALVLPFSTFRLTPKRARIISTVTWIVGALLAAIPLLPPLSHWQFYSQNAVCVPLPITRLTFPGSDYAFSIFIVFNFVIFMSILVAQVLIFRAVRASSRKVKATQADRRQKETKIAQKLALIVITDFLCWFPIGIMGILAKGSVPISSEANIVATIFILPLNSALNPYLYTLPALMDKLGERKRKWQLEEQRRKNLVNKNPRTSEKWRLPKSDKRPVRRLAKAANGGLEKNPDVCLDKLRLWLRTGRLSDGHVSQILSRFQTNCCVPE